VRSPGVIYQRGRDAKTYATGTIHPYRGEWIEFDIETKPGKEPTAGARVARKRRLSLFVLLRALGYTDEAFLTSFARYFDFLETQWDKERDLAPTQEEALLEIYKRARPGEPPNVDSARNYFEGAFFSPKRYDLTRVGRYKLNRKLGPEIDKIAELFPMLDLERPTPTRACCRGPSCSPPARTCSTSARTSPATASTTRTTSPTAASAASAS
jgi:DNA-directed RNA polymerase subunit beta